MTGYLLDTHVMLWWLAGADMSAEAEQVIDDASHEVFLSSASAWEMSIKQSKGRLTVPADLTRLIADAGIQVLTVRWAHAWAAGQLPGHHQDPFDRLLIAQAQSEGLTLVTADARLHSYAVPIIAA